MIDSLLSESEFSELKNFQNSEPNRSGLLLSLEKIQAPNESFCWQEFLFLNQISQIKNDSGATQKSYINLGSEFWKFFNPENSDSDNDESIMQLSESEFSELKNFQKCDKVDLILQIIIT